MSALLWFFSGAMLGLLVLAVHRAVQWLMQPFNVAVMAVSAIHHQRELERAYRMQQQAIVEQERLRAAMEETP
ncbi:TPA: hypothetical protein ACOEPM_000306 [Stenotrophomonas maltophilia]